MRRIKLFFLALALSLVGSLYAPGGYAQSTAQETKKDQPVASCCTSTADCCKEGASCCASKEAKKHTTQHAKAGDDTKSCCTSAASCCNDGASCCANHKADGSQSTEQACSMNNKEGASCCKEGASRCADGSCSTTSTQ